MISGTEDETEHVYEKGGGWLQVPQTPVQQVEGRKMIAVLITMALVIGLFAGFGLGAIWVARIKATEIANKAGYSPKELKRRNALLRESMGLIHGFLNPTTLQGELDYLSKPSREKAEKLLNEYNKEVS